MTIYPLPFSIKSFVIKTFKCSVTLGLVVPMKPASSSCLINSLGFDVNSEHPLIHVLAHLSIMVYFSCDDDNISSFSIDDSRAVIFSHCIRITKKGCV